MDSSAIRISFGRRSRSVRRMCTVICHLSALQRPVSKLFLNKTAFTTAAHLTCLRVRTSSIMHAHSYLIFMIPYFSSLLNNIWRLAEIFKMFIYYVTGRKLYVCMANKINRVKKRLEIIWVNIYLTIIKINVCQCYYYLYY